MSVLELNLLNEICPIEVNILLYFVSMILILLFSYILANIIIQFNQRIKKLIDENKYYSYLIAIITLSFIQRVLNSLLPDWLSIIFTWLNWRVLLPMLAPIIALIVISNAIEKKNNIVITSSIDTFIFLLEIPISLVFRYQWQIITKFKANFSAIHIVLLFVIGYVTLLCQFKYGSRFFLPNRCRKRRYEYRRKIADDFELSKLDESMWPEWDYWFQKLHLPSLNAEGRNLSKIEGKEWFGVYMKSPYGENLHYFCLDKIIRESKDDYIYLIKIDNYDD